MEIDLFQDGGQIKIKKNVDHYNANKMPIDSHLPQADPFSLVPTFNKLERFFRFLVFLIFQKQIYSGFILAERELLYNWFDRSAHLIFCPS